MDQTPSVQTYCWEWMNLGSVYPSHTLIPNIFDDDSNNKNNVFTKGKSCLLLLVVVTTAWNAV